MLHRYIKHIRYIIHIEKEHNNDICEEGGHPVIELNVKIIIIIKIFFSIRHGQHADCLRLVNRYSVVLIPTIIVQEYIVELPLTCLYTCSTVLSLCPRFFLVEY